jgi:hypothetical protein
MMLGAPQRIEAARLGEIGHRHFVGVHRRVAHRVADVLEERRHSDMHEMPSG